MGRVVDFKRTHIIPDVSALINLPIKWVHFGDGPLMETLKKKCQKLPPNIIVELKGHIDNKDVLRFYENNYIDLFLSLSLSEGLPVSMMEAISFGIPIAGTSVCGVPEIVNEKTGLLLNPEMEYEAIGKVLQRFLLKNELKKEEIIEFFEENFWADKNYLNFVEKISGK